MRLIQKKFSNPYFQLEWVYTSGEMTILELFDNWLDAKKALDSFKKNNPDRLGFIAGRDEETRPQATEFQNSLSCSCLPLFSDLSISIS